MPLRFQDGNSCTQMRRRIVKKFQHQRVPFEHLLDDAALHTLPTAVDEPHFAQPGGVCFVDVLFDHRRDVSRGESVEVEDCPRWECGAGPDLAP